MPTKPSLYPNWTSGTSPEVTQPPSSLQTSGWLPGEPPQPDFMNWLFWLLCQWIIWFDYSTTTSFQPVDSTFIMATPNAQYLCNTAGGAYNGTFPSAASNPGVEFQVKNISFSSGNNVTLVPTGGDLVEGGASATLAPGDAQIWFSDGVSNWYLMNA